MFDQPVQLEIFPTDLHLRRIDRAYNMRRFYRLRVQRDLFGGACLIREWGRIGYQGQIMIETHDDEGKAITALMKLAAAKRKRGYLGIGTSDLGQESQTRSPTRPVRLSAARS